jgi:polysulfide reductase chain C
VLGHYLKKGDISMGLGTVWGPLLAWDLFLAGMGAGAFLVSWVASQLSAKYQPLVKAGIWLGAPLAALGSLLLLLDLGNPFGFYLAFLRLGRSLMSIGILTISIFIVLAGIRLLTVLFPQVKLGEGVIKWLSGLAALFAFGTAVYTGLLLGVVRAVPFWNTPMLPLLFLVSALLTGTGAVLVVLWLQTLIRPVSGAEAEQFSASEQLLGRIGLVLIGVELLVLYFFLFIMTGGQNVSAQSAQYLVAGGFAVAFWVGLVIIGLIVPGLLEVWSLRSEKGLSVWALAGLCLLVGGIVLRYAILSAGQNVSSALYGI